MSVTKILNPMTGNMVLRTGKIGRHILRSQGLLLDRITYAAVYDTFDECARSYIQAIIDKMRKDRWWYIKTVDSSPFVAMETLREGYRSDLPKFVPPVADAEKFERLDKRIANAMDIAGFKAWTFYDCEVPEWYNSAGNIDKPLAELTEIDDLAKYAYIEVYKIAKTCL